MSNRLAQLLLIFAFVFTTGCGNSESETNGSGHSSSSSSSSSTGQPASSTPTKSALRPAVSDSAHHKLLVRCIDIEKAKDACFLSYLPFIGQETLAPTKADIMARVIVSHPWMATRFSELLDEMPDDIYLLFRGVTGIVIGADIRPSHYWSVTGAIYLDPADLWLTSSERSTISQAPDYRSEFARELSFISLSRYVQGNQYAWDYYPLDSTISARPLSTIIKPMASLLFHELAHANDFIPPGQLSHINPNNKPVDQAIAFEEQNISLGLFNAASLNSDLLYALAEVMYFGTPATAELKNINAETVGLAFEIDGANDLYGYASLFEDTAMLFEEVMMKHHFNVDRELAFTDAPMTADAYCDDYVVRWGQRNRMGDPSVKARASLVLQGLLDKPNSTDYTNKIPAPKSLINGIDWCNNLTHSSNKNSLGIQNLTPANLRSSDQRLPARHSHNPFERLP